MTPDHRPTALLDAVPDAIVVIDEEGRILLVNSFAESLFGHGRDDLVGRHHRMILGDAFGDHLRTVLADHDTGSRVHQAGAELDVNGRRSDGTEFPMEINYTITNDKDRVEIVAAVRDVSERREAEAELRRALSLVNATLESTADGILVVSGDGRIAGANERFAELWRIPEELLMSGDDARVMGYVLDQLVDAPAFVAKVHELYEHPGEESNDVLEFRDGRIFERYSRPQRVDEEIVGRVWSFRDVTSRERAQDRARQALADLSSVDARFRALVESSDDPILSTTPEGVITSWNAAAERLFGWSREEILGQPFSRLVPDDAHEALDVHRLATTRGSVRGSIEVDLVRSSGARVPGSLTVSPIYDDERVVGVSAIIRDITETQDRQRELVQARTSAIEAFRAKSDFLATMSHEIRTPMNGVIGLTGLLLNTGLDAVQRRYAAGVRGAGEALLAIVDDILDFSKLEAGKVDLEYVAFSPRQLVEELGVLLAESATGQGLEFLVSADETVPSTVIGDPRRLRQVLINLTGNAIKFTPVGEVEVRVSAVAPVPSAVGEPVTVRFDVRDTGIGIEPETLGRLFEPFSQADASTTRRFGGTGLGLAISDRLVSAMGGELTVASELLAGSTFTLTLRLPLAEAPALPSGDRQDLELCSALVVDDNTSNRTILVTQLEGLGLSAVHAAADAESALTRLRSAAADGRPYDLALLDLLMPGTDGLSLAETMAGDPALSVTGVLMLTSGGDLDITRARAAGVTEWVSKPVRPAELAEAMLRLINRESHPQVTQSLITSAAETTSPTRPHRVLVAEDNAVNQMVAIGLLEELGYETDLAADGQQALASLDAGTYAAVLMDCHMPLMDGFEATRELRARERGGPRTPVIAMTAGVLDEDRERCRAAGMDDFVAKPIDLDHLRETLARWVDAEGEPDAMELAAVLDLAQLETLRRIGTGDGWGVLPAVARLYAEGADGLAASLRDAVAADDQDAVRVAAHTLKGASANLGAERVVAACLRMERAVDEDAAPTTDLLATVERELRAAVAALQDLIDQAP